MRALQIAPLVVVLGAAACKKDEGKAEDKTAEADKDDGDKSEKKDKEGGDKAKDDKAKTKEKDGGDSEEPKEEPKEVAAAAPSAGAHERLPDDCAIAANINVKALLANPKVKSDLVPHLQAAVDTKEPKDEEFKDFQKFLSATGIKFDSFGNIAICVKDVGLAPTFAVAIGGSFAKDSIVPALKAGADAEDQSKYKELDGHPAIVDDTAVAMQLEDGTFAVASTEAYLGKLKAKNKNYSDKYKLDVGKVVSANVGAEVMKMMPPMGEAAPAGLASMKGVNGYISLEPAEAKFTFACASDQDATEVAAFMTVMKNPMVAQAKEGEALGATDAIKAAKIEASGSNVVLTIPIPLDKLVAAAGPMLKEAAGGV